MNLLLVCWGDPFTTQAGTEIFAGDLAVELAKQGHNVHILYGGKNHPHPEVKYLITHPLHIFNIPYVRTLDFQRKYTNLCVRLIDKLDIRAIIAFGAGTFPSYAFNKIKRLKKKPLLVYYAIDTMKMEYERSKLSVESKGLLTSFKRWIRFIALIKSDETSCINSDLVFASSRDTASHIISDYGIPPGKVKVLHLGIPDNFAEGIESVDPNTPVFLHVAGGPRKGTGYLLKAMKLLEKKYALKTKAIITRATLAQAKQAKELGIDAEVHGSMPRLELKRFYASCTALVSPSLSEGFCLPVIEAAMFGKPAIVSNTGSLPELVIDGENGFIVPVADTITLAERMYQIAVSKQLRRHMGEKAKRFSQRFKISNIAKTLIELLDNKL